MKKISIIIPIYNDWESVIKLLANINIILREFKKDQFKFDCILINDASQTERPKLKIPEMIERLIIVNIKKNQGHARCIAFGIRYLSKKSDVDYGIIMDGDGEDRPEEIKMLLEKVILKENVSVVAKRVKRSEGIFFKTSYEIHKILTYVFTGKKINFGNYSCLTKNDINELSNKSSLWNSFSGSIKKYLLDYDTINSIRGKRYFGPSKMSFLKLLIHSLSIIAVFKETVFLRSVLLLIVSSYFTFKINYAIAIFQLLLVVFNLIIYLISLKESKEGLIQSEKNVESINIYTQ